MKSSGDISLHVWQERGTDFYSHKKETKTHTNTQSTKTEFRTVHTSTLIQYSNTNRTVGLTLGASAGCSPFTSFRLQCASRVALLPPGCSIPRTYAFNSGATQRAINGCIYRDLESADAFRCGPQLWKSFAAGRC